MHDTATPSDMAAHATINKLLNNVRVFIMTTKLMQFEDNTK